MGDGFRQELKFLYLAQMLQRKTDEEHPAGLRSMSAYLKELGITEEEETLKKDLEILREYGLDIEVSEGEESLYCLRSRVLSGGDKNSYGYGTVFRDYYEKKKGSTHCENRKAYKCV